MGFAYNTRIAIPSGGEVPIQLLAVGDPVLAATLRPGEAPLWEPLEVEFSDGIGPGRPVTMVSIVFTDGGLSLVCGPDQLLVGADGRLVPADAFAAGDALMRPDGGRRVIAALGLGRFNGGLHDVATSRDRDRDRSPDGHLLAADGVIAADQFLQLHLGPAAREAAPAKTPRPRTSPPTRRTRKK